jgi:hypothetical protein
MTSPAFANAARAELDGVSFGVSKRAQPTGSMWLWSPR